VDHNQKEIKFTFSRIIVARSLVHIQDVLKTNMPYFGTAFLIC